MSICEPTVLDLVDEKKMKIYDNLSGKDDFTESIFNQRLSGHYSGS